MGMRGKTRRLGLYAGGVGALLAGLYMAFTPVFAQNAPAAGAKAPQKIAGNFNDAHILPPGGPAPRAPDGHPDLTGRYYPKQDGRMLEGAYPIDRSTTRQY